MCKISISFNLIRVILIRVILLKEIAGLLFHLHVKSIRFQIIKGLHDVDTMEDFLQKFELTLATTVVKCRSQEAAKRAGHSC